MNTETPSLEIFLVRDNDPVLRRIAEPVSDIPTQVWPHISDMRIIMKQHGGIGLAAPQVGLSLRFFVMRGLGVVINPVIVSRSPRRISKSEGCLSFPGRSTYVGRADWIGAEWTDRNGEPCSATMRDLTARVFQHETDHLNGICIF